jgi:hypothetical protein
MITDDDRLLSEAYEEIHEGVLRRGASRVASGGKAVTGVVGAVPDLVKGKAKELGGKALSGMGAKTAGKELQKVGRAQLDDAQQHRQYGKQEHYVASTLDEIENDVKKLWPEEFEASGDSFINDIESVFKKYFKTGKESWVSKIARRSA